MLCPCCCVCAVCLSLSCPHCAWLMHMHAHKWFMNVSCMNSYPALCVCVLFCSHWCMSPSPLCVCVCVCVPATQRGQSTSTYQRRPLRLTVQTAWSQRPAPKTQAHQRTRVRAQTTTMVMTPTEEVGTDRARQKHWCEASQRARWRDAQMAPMDYVPRFCRMQTRWRECCSCCCRVKNNHIVQERKESSVWKFPNENKEIRVMKMKALEQDQ